MVAAKPMQIDYREMVREMVQEPFLAYTTTICNIMARKDPDRYGGGRATNSTEVGKWTIRIRQCGGVSNTDGAGDECRCSGLAEDSRESF